MQPAKQIVLVGVFEDREHARRAFDELIRAGFAEEQIGIVGKSDKLKEAGLSKPERDAAEGALLGGSVGAIWGIAIAAGLLTGIGPVLVGGALAAIFASAAAGAAVGGIAGVLTGWGVPEEEARHYEKQLQAGRILITVRPEGRFNEALTILKRHEAPSELHTITDQAPPRA